MTEHNLDETTSDVSRGVRITVMMGMQIAEQAARRRAEAHRQAAAESRERAAQVREAMSEARETARATYEPVADPRRFAQADRETAVGAWTVAKAWSEVDPRAAAAEASLAEQIRQRWGVDANDPGRRPEQRFEAEPDREVTPAVETPPITSQQERLIEAMSPEWRQEATVEELEQRWHEANNMIDQPGALDARTAVEGELGDRLGLDIDKFNRTVEHGLGEEAWAAAGDRAAADADRAAEGSERLEEAGWENQADAEHGREAAADDPGEETEESADALEAEGKGAESAADAETEHGLAQREDGAALTQQNAAESRANTADMAAAGVSSRSQAVRAKTAKAFGALPAAINRIKQHRNARKNVNRKGRGAEKEMGR
ncbi:hypothetical protein [Janibacter corallicola]|uniref:hypothetical protein n=1 Tax=Janibacter corallicola TaxID=415212 RepID=UPI00082E1B9A|nr:hypothetical protein [Janibacter corallicola]